MGLSSGSAYRVSVGFPSGNAANDILNVIPKNATEFRGALDIIPDGQILIHGISMGGGIALDLATVQMRNVKCLVLDAPSDNVENVLRGSTFYRFKDKADKIYPYVRDRFVREFGAEPSDFNRVQTLQNGKYPILLSAGSMENCEELFAQLKHANPMPTHTVILPGCNHGNGMYKQTDMYQNAIQELIDRYMET